MGKYAHLKGKVSALPDDLAYRNEGKSFLESVNTVERDVVTEMDAANRTGSRFATDYIRLKQRKNELNAELKDLKIQMEAYKRLTITSFEDEGLESVRLAVGFNVFHNVEPIGIVTDRDANRRWAEENNLKRLLMLPPATITSLVKEMLLKGDELPDGVSAYMKDKLLVRKA